MKQIDLKKLLALLLSVVMVFALTVSAYAAEDSEDEEVNPVLGYIDGSDYINEYFGISCTLPDEWSFFSDEELLELQGAAAELLEDTDMEKYLDAFLEDNESCYVMAAVSEEGLQNINVIVENLHGIGSFISEDDLIQIVMNELGLEEGGDLSSMGLEGATIETNSIIFADEERSGLTLTYTDSSAGFDISMYMQMVFIIQEDYAVQVTMTSVFDETGIDNMTGFFAPLADEEGAEAEEADDSADGDTCVYKYSDGTICGEPTNDYEGLCDEHFEVMYAMFQSLGGLGESND